MKDVPSSNLRVVNIGPEYPVYNSGTYYGDGSGGIYTSHPTIRRCGVSLIKADSSGNLRFAARMNLPGARQTVPRAEYLAFHHLIMRAEVGATVEYVTDHLPLKKLLTVACTQRIRYLIGT